MSDSAFRLEALRLLRSPGFPRGGPKLESLSPGVNLILGANASGKSSLVRAALALLSAAEDSKEPGMSVTGSLRRGDDAWELVRDDERLRVLRKGQELSSPLPPIAKLHRHALSLHDLLVAEDGDLAEALLREAAGGFDVAAAAREMGFVLQGASAKRAEVGAWKQAIRQLAEVERGQRDLRKQLDGREGLERRIDEATRAHEEERRFEWALEIIELRGREARHLEAGKAFPDFMAELDGNENRLLDELDGDLHRLRNEGEELRTRSEQAESRREKLTALGALPRMEESLAGLRGRMEALEAVEGEERDSDRDLAELEGRRRRSLLDLGMEGDGDGLDLPEVEENVLEAWKNVARREGDLRSRLQALNELEGWLEEPEAEHGREDALGSAVKDLRSWLATPAPGRIPRGRLVLALALLVIAFLAPEILSRSVPGLPPGDLPTWLLPIAALLGCLPLLRDPAGDMRILLRRSFQKTDFAPPEAWTESSVERRLVELQEQWDSCRLRKNRRERWSHLPRLRRDLERERMALDEERRALPLWNADRSSGRDLQLVLSADALLSYRKARRDLEARRSSRRSLADRRRQLLEGMAETFDGLGLSLPERAIEGRRQLEVLTSQVRDLRDAERILSESRIRSQRIEEEIREKTARRERLFTKLDLDGTSSRDEALLREACERRGAWKDWLAESRILGHDLASTVKKLGDDEALAEMPSNELERRRDEARRRSESLKELHKELGILQEAVKRRKDGSDLELAQARLEEARDGLEELRRTLAEQRVGTILARHLDAQARQRQLPPVFHRAQEIFTAITRGQFAIEIGLEDPPRFRGVDTRSQQRLDLPELSSATRLQLLLSLRVAFLEEGEAGHPLPLFLDETLGNTDDLRAEYVVDALMEIARQGRQLFYFTARGDEIETWTERLKRDDALPWTVHRLGEKARPGRSLNRSGLRRQLPAPPPPSASTHDAYGRQLEVERLDPWSPVTSCHLWYLVPDPLRLHTLLDELRLSTWGELSNLLAHMERKPEWLEEMLPRLRSHALVLERLLALWRSGRGRPLNAELLASSAALTATTHPRVRELAEAHEWNAREVMADIERGELKNFRAAKREQLREEWEDAGCLPRETPLALPEVERLVRAAALEHDPLLRPRAETLASWMDQLPAPKR